MFMSNFPKAPINRILKQYNPRASASAVDTLCEIIDNIMDDISEGSADFRKASGRKTVKGTDVLRAAKLLRLY